MSMASQLRLARATASISRSGMAYVAVLLLALLLSSLGLTFIFTVRTQTLAATGRLDAIQAAYLAESAANHALWRVLNEDDDVNAYVAQDSDDAQQDYDEDCELYDQKLELGQRWYVGLRFLDVAVPQGETISVARVQFTAADKDNESTDLTIYGQDTANAGKFGNEEDDLSRRRKTSASVRWHGISTWEKDHLYETPDLAPIVQEIVNRPGWIAGNAMVLLFRSNDPSGKRRAYAHDEAMKTPALLTIAYGQRLPMTPTDYTMHAMAGGRYGYKVRRPTAVSFGTIATVGAAGESTVQQGYVVHVGRDRRPIDVSNPGPALTAYPVPVALTTAKLGFPYVGINADGSDIRFAGAGGSALDYWIESWDNMGASKVWVKVPSIPAGGSVIYMTHGDADAVSESDGQATFLYYDGFEDHDDGDTADGWSPAAYTVKADGPVMALDDKDEDAEVVHAASADWSDIAVRQRFKCKTGSINHAGLILRRRNNDNLVYGGVAKVNISGYFDIAQVWERDGGSWVKAGGDWGIPDVSSGWHVQELAIYGNAVAFSLDDHLEGITTVSSGVPASGNTGFRSQYSERAYRDWHLVRPYRSPEPTATLR